MPSHIQSQSCNKFLTSKKTEIWLAWSSISLYNLSVTLEIKYMLNRFYILNVEDISLSLLLFENWSNAEDITHGVLLLMKQMKSRLRVIPRKKIVVFVVCFVFYTSIERTKRRPKYKITDQIKNIKDMNYVSLHIDDVMTECVHIS